MPGYTLECFTVEAEAETPASGDTVVIDQDAITVNDCFMNLTYPVAVEVEEDLELVVDYNGGNPQAQLVIPDGGLEASYTTSGGPCELTVNDSTVGPIAYDNGTGVASGTNVPAVSFTASANPVACPSSGTASVDTTLQFDLVNEDGHPIIEP